MTATTLLTDLRALGVTLQPHGDRLRFHPREAVTAELLAGIKEHKAELLRLLAEPLPGVDLQAQNDDYAPEGITLSPDGETVIKPFSNGVNGHFRRLAGNGFPPFPCGPIDPRIIADPVAMCTTCNAARVLVELRTMTGWLCWDCHQREQQRGQSARSNHGESCKPAPEASPLDDGFGAMALQETCDESWA